MNILYNYGIYNKGFVDECDKEEKCGSYWGGCYFLFEMNIVKLYDQCHIFGQSRPERQPNDILV